VADPLGVHAFLLLRKASVSWFVQLANVISDLDVKTSSKSFVLSRKQAQTVSQQMANE
jgi:hypothetical protein